MGKTLEQYWDLETCGWVKASAVEIPAQAGPAEQPEPTSVSAMEDGDVRSE